MKKTAYFLGLLAAVVFLLGGCAAEDLGGPTAEVPPAAPENILCGRSVDELGLSYVYEIENMPADASPEEALLYRVRTQYTGKNSSLFGKYGALRSNFSYLTFGVYVENSPIAYPAPLMILQGFLKSDLALTSPIIRVNGENRSPEEFTEYIVYEDDLVVVYDMRYPLSGLSVREFLEEYDQTADWWKVKPELDIEELLGVYDTLTASEEHFLKRTGEVKEHLAISCIE